MSTKSGNRFGWKTSYVTVQLFKRWAIIVTVLTGIVGGLIAGQMADNKREMLKESAVSRLEVQTNGRAELVRLWTDNLLALGRNIINSDLMRLYATEMTAVARGEAASELADSLSAQEPYMVYMINEFAKQQGLISAYLINGEGAIMVSSEDTPPLSNTVMLDVERALNQGQDIIRPARAVGAEILVDVIRPIFPLAESGDANVATGALVTTHNISTDIARLLEPQPLDDAGESFAIIQQDENGYSELNSAGLAPIAELPIPGNMELAMSIQDSESQALPVAQPVPNTPFLAWGEYAIKHLGSALTDSRQAIYSGAIVITLLVMVLGLVALWFLLDKYTKQRGKLQDQTMQTLVRAIEIRDPYLAGHHQRLARTTLAVANQLKLDTEDRTTLFYAAQLCGIGMIFVPQEILTKPGKLTAAERKQLEEHVKHAQEVLEGVDFDLPIRDVIIQMHERVDGSGYPKKLKGDKINKLARILGACDVFCAMTSPRIYRQGMKQNVALEEMDKNIKQFDPAIVAALKAAATAGRLPTSKKTA